MSEPTDLQRLIAEAVLFCPLPSLDQVPAPDVRALVDAIIARCIANPAVVLDALGFPGLAALREANDRIEVSAAKRKRQEQIEMLKACQCEWPDVRVRNMVGHPESCPAYAVWQRQHNPKPEGSR